MSPSPFATITNLVTPPTLPNILTGLVTDAAGQSQENVIVEIIDQKTGIPARALRSNRTGLFQIATPLSPGSYQIRAEKDGLTFSPISISVQNTVLPPIIIQANKTA